MVRANIFLKFIVLVANVLAASIHATTFHKHHLRQRRQVQPKSRFIERTHIYAYTDDEHLNQRKEKQHKSSKRGTRKLVSSKEGENPPAVLSQSPRSLFVCEDRIVGKFMVTQPNGARLIRSCKWVGGENTEKRCSFEGVASQCPRTCGLCTNMPSMSPSTEPTTTQAPSMEPTAAPSQLPSMEPTAAPSQLPSMKPTTASNQVPTIPLFPNEGQNINGIERAPSFFENRVVISTLSIFSAFAIFILIGGVFMTRRLTNKSDNDVLDHLSDEVQEGNHVSVEVEVALQSSKSNESWLKRSTRHEEGGVCCGCSFLQPSFISNSQR